MLLIRLLLTPVRHRAPPVTEPVRSTTMAPVEARWMCAASGVAILFHVIVAQTLPRFLLRVTRALPAPSGSPLGRSRALRLTTRLADEASTGALARAPETSRTRLAPSAS